MMTSTLPLPGTSTTSVLLNPPLARSLALSLSFIPALSASENPATTDPRIVELDPLEVQATRPEAVLASSKFTQPLVDIPQTFSVISADVFNQQGAASLSDVLRNTPGITFTAGEGGNVASGDTFTMRGTDASGSIFIDGVRDSGAYSRDVFNTEQVEIAKGPAGADNGRGGASGYVNLVTKTPQLENFGRATASYGMSEHAGDDQRRATLDINQTLGSSPTAPSPTSGAAFRLNLYGADSGVPGRDEVHNTGWGIAPSLALGLGTPTRILAAASYATQDNLPDTGVPSVGLRSGLFLDPAGASTTLTPIASPIARDIRSNFYGFADSDYEKIISRSALLRLEHDLAPNAKISNQTKLAETDRDSVTSYIRNAAAYDSATGLVSVRRIRTESDNTILANQTNLTLDFDTGPIAHDLSLGLDLSRESQFTPLSAPFDAPGVSVTSPDPHRTPAGAPTRYANGAFNEAVIDTAAVYAFETLHLTERLMLNLSGRLEHYESEFTQRPTPTGAIPDPATIRLYGSDTLFSYKLGVVFKPRPEGSLYAAYGNSFTPPGTNFNFSTQAGNANDPATAPEEAHNYELGVKWEFFRQKLSANLAFFRSINENIATNLGTNAAPDYVYDGEQRTEGIEFGLSGKITPECLVYGGVGYVESETVSALADRDGAPLRYTPRLSATFYTTYAVAKRLTIGGGAQYTETVSRLTTLDAAGSSSNATTSYVAIGVPSYWLFNALVEYAATEHLSLRLNANNLFDEESYRLNNNGGRYYPGAPRTFTLTADYRF